MYSNRVNVCFQGAGCRWWVVAWWCAVTPPPARVVAPLAVTTTSPYNCRRPSALPNQTLIPPTPPTSHPSSPISQSSPRSPRPAFSVSIRSHPLDVQSGITLSAPAAEVMPISECRLVQRGGGGGGRFSPPCPRPRRLERCCSSGRRVYIVAGYDSQARSCDCDMNRFRDAAGAVRLILS